MNRQELYAKARQAVASRRQRAETEAICRRSEYDEALPKLAEIEAEISETGAMAARLAALGEKEAAQSKLALLEGVAQRREALLRSAGITAAALGPRYQCKKCNDSGYYDGNVCECIHVEARRLRREEINASGPLTVSSFDTFDVSRYPTQAEGINFSPRFAMGEVLRECRDYVTDFGPNSPSLYLYGDAGLGKSHLALAIAAGVLEKGVDVIYVSAQSVFAQMSREKKEFNESGELFPSMLEAELLVFDDLGTEFLDQYILSRLYELVNTRMNRRPTIYTSNIIRQDLLHQRYTEKIASRLLGECHCIRFYGMDQRLTGE